MTKLGTEILDAMRAQGWMVMIDDESVTTISVTGQHRIVPLELLQEGEERRLHYVLLAWIVADGLCWPWPPRHVTDVVGDQVRE
jgi:hypothetical protein